MFQWLIGIIAVLVFIFIGYFDSLAGKKKHSRYFQEVQKPTGKTERFPVVPEPHKHDQFFSKLNSL